MSVKKPITVSVIISFYNKLDALKCILVALELQTFKNFEVVVADDGSRQEVVNELLAYIPTLNLHIQHVWHEDKGWRKNKILNKSVQASVGEYLVFLDGDCIPHPTFLAEHNLFKKEKTVIAGRRVMLSPKMSQEINAQKIQNQFLGFPITWAIIKEAALAKSQPHWENAIRVKNKSLRKLFIQQKNRGLVGCNFSLHRIDLIAVNGFDERFVHPGCGEDVDLELRLRNNGCQVKAYKHLLTVYHLHHKSLSLDATEWHLYNENKKNNISYTPYGIQQH